MFPKFVPAFLLMCFGATQTFIITTLPYLREKTELSLSTLVLGLSLGTLCFLPGTFFWNTRSDEGKTYSSLTWNAFFLSLSVLTLYLLFSYPLIQGPALSIFLAGRILWGLGSSGISGINQKLRLENKHAKIKSLSGNSFVLNLGRTIGPCLVLLPVAIDEVLLGLFAITAFCFGISLFLKDQKSEKNQNETSLFQLSTTLMPALVLCFLMSFGTGYIHSGLGAFIEKTYLLSATDAMKFTGKLLLGGSVFLMIAQLFARKFKDESWQRLIWVGSGLFSSGLLLFLFPVSMKMLYAIIALVCFGTALLYPSIIMLMDILSAEVSKGKSLAMIGIMSTLGTAAGGVLFSVTYTYFEMILSLIALVIIAAVVKTIPVKSEVLWKA